MNKKIINYLNQLGFELGIPILIIIGIVGAVVFMDSFDIIMCGGL